MGINFQKRVRILPRAGHAPALKKASSHTAAKNARKVEMHRLPATRRKTGFHRKLFLKYYVHQLYRDLTHMQQHTLISKVSTHGISITLRKWISLTYLESKVIEISVGYSIKSDEAFTLLFFTKSIHSKHCGNLLYKFLYREPFYSASRRCYWHNESNQPVFTVSSHIFWA